MPIQICILMCFLIRIVPNVSNDDLYPHLQDATKFRENQRKIFITHTFVQSPDNYPLESLFLCPFHWKKYLTYIMMTFSLFFFSWHSSTVHTRISFLNYTYSLDLTLNKDILIHIWGEKEQFAHIHTPLFQLERRGGTKCHPKSRDPCSFMCTLPILSYLLLWSL